jgi:hypothetical protein
VPAPEAPVFMAFEWDDCMVRKNTLRVS